MNKVIELIAQELNEMRNKHGYTIEHDILCNSGKERNLAVAARNLSEIGIDNSKTIAEAFRPINWDYKIWQHMAQKPYKQRLIIAAAFLAAEYERIEEMENQLKKDEHD